MKYAESLNQWFLQYQREMPWRLTHDPYCIWVSEIMLQQTQVETVIPYYERFIKSFPTLKALAQANLDEVFYLWKGLGYYRRAENLHKGARLIIEAFGGHIPQAMEELAKIPGIGPYTAGAILSIAFNLPVPAVDGNVMRILARQFALQEDISKPKARKTFENLVLQLMEGEPRIFNQAMMELGALVCTPKGPKCAICPQMHLCKAYAQGEAEAYPVKSKKPKPLVEEYIALIIQKENTYLMEKRPADGLLANLWGFPLIERNLFLGNSKQGGLSGSIEESGCSGAEGIHRELTEKALLEQLMGTKIKVLEPIRHVFTHRKWLLKPVVIEYSSHIEARLEKYLSSCSTQFFTFNAIKELPIATVFQRAIDQLG